MSGIFKKSGTVGTTLIADIDPQMHFREGFLYLRFANSAFDDTGETPDPALVTPSAGTVTATVSDDGTNYSDIPNGAGIDVTTANYTRPSFYGLAVNGKVVPTGITGATHWQAVWARW